MTLEPSKRNTKKQNKKKTKKDKKEKKQEKTKNTQKWAFQLSVKVFFFFGWVSKISLFWQLGPKSAHPKNTIKIGVSANFFFGKHICVTKRPFLDQKNLNSWIPVIIFFCLFSSLSTTENTTKCWNPYFYSVLTNQKREFSNVILKTLKIEKPNFCTLFWKRLFLENCQIIGHKKNTKW